MMKHYLMNIYTSFEDFLFSVFVIFRLHCDQHFRFLGSSSELPPTSGKNMKNCAIIQNAFSAPPSAAKLNTHISLSKFAGKNKSLAHHLFMLFICFVYVHAFDET